MDDSKNISSEISYTITRKLGKADITGKKYDAVNVRLPKTLTSLWCWKPGDNIKIHVDNKAERLIIER